MLKDLAARIFADEVRHYKHFYYHFRRYNRREHHSRLRIGRTLLRRLLETRSAMGITPTGSCGTVGNPPARHALIRLSCLRAFLRYLRAPSWPSRNDHPDVSQAVATADAIRGMGDPT